jgi:hypothetical protein
MGHAGNDQRLTSQVESRTIIGRGKAIWAWMNVRRVSSARWDYTDRRETHEPS